MNLIILVENTDQLISSGLSCHTGKVDNVSTPLVEHVGQESLQKDMKIGEEYFGISGRKPRKKM